MTARNGHGEVAFAGELGSLLPHHAALLEASSISAEIATQRGYRSVTAASELEVLGFAPDQRRVPGLLIPIRDAHGQVAYHQLRPDEPRERDAKKVKYETASKKWRSTRGLPSAGTVVDVPPASLEAISDASRPLWITEGARKADAAASTGLCCVDLIGVWGFRCPRDEDPAQRPLPDWERFELNKRRVYVAFDSDVMTKPSVRKALAALKSFLDDQGADVRLIYLPATEDGEKVGLDDFLAAGGTERDLLEHATAELLDPNGTGRKVPSQATQLIELAGQAGVELFHTPFGETWASFPVEGHRETHPTGSLAFRRWLARSFRQEGQTLGAQALQDALLELEGRAAYDGPERDVYTRVAELDDAVYIDLADPSWQAVEIRPSITSPGWRVVSEPPVKFRRKRGTLALPLPAHGGSIEELRDFVNVKDDDGWTQLAGWLVGAYAPRGAYAMLALHGEHGSAKSTTARVLRKLIDPSTSELRSEPREERDLMITASNGWLLAFDNLSKISDRMSDALCRLSTGGGFSTRQLHTDDEEVMFDVQRPLLVTGIEELVTRPDLLDRTIMLELPRISPEDRRTERAFWEAFEHARSRILGALLEAVAGAVAHRDEVELPSKPRLADLAVWVTAAEPTLGWTHLRFVSALEVSRAAANDVALEASPIGQSLRELVEADGLVEGTAGELLVRLDERIDDSVSKPRDWPKNARSLSGHLRRLASNLRSAGINVEGPVREAGTGRRVWTLSKTAEICVTTVTPVTESSETQAASQLGRDANPTGCDANRPGVTQTSLLGSPAAGAGCDGRDGCDANPGDNRAAPRATPAQALATTEEEEEAERLLRKFGNEKPAGLAEEERAT